MGYAGGGWLKAILRKEKHLSKAARGGVQGLISMGVSPSRWQPLMAKLSGALESKRFQNSKKRVLNSKRRLSTRHNLWHSENLEPIASFKLLQVLTLLDF